MWIVKNESRITYQDTQHMNTQAAHIICEQLTMFSARPRGKGASFRKICSENSKVAGCQETGNSVVYANKY